MPHALILPFESIREVAVKTLRVDDPRGDTPGLGRRYPGANSHTLLEHSFKDDFPAQPYSFLALAAMVIAASD